MSRLITLLTLMLLSLAGTRAEADGTLTGHVTLHAHADLGPGLSEDTAIDASVTVRVLGNTITVCAASGTGVFTAEAPGSGCDREPEVRSGNVIGGNLSFFGDPLEASLDLRVLGTSTHTSCVDPKVVTPFEGTLPDGALRGTPTFANGSLTAIDFNGGFTDGAMTVVTTGILLPSAVNCSGPTPVPTPTDDFVNWVNGAGGSFGDVGNWEPAAVPGETQTARFLLPGTYVVTGAAGRIRRAVINNGSVILQGGLLELLELALAAPSAAIGGATLDLQGGGTVRSSHVSVGAGGSSDSGLGVAEAGTRWESSGRVTVGDTSAGFLSVTEGGTLVSAESRIGESADGDASVEGDDSSWTTGNIAVGTAAPGTLRIEGGGLVRSGEGVVGLTTTSFGLVEVLGAGTQGVASLWQLQTLRVGAGGTGSLLIDEGGNVSVVDSVTVGGDVLGEVTITKESSALDAGRLVVGGTLGGSVDVSAGGHVIALDTQLGPGAGEGDMTVSGIFTESERLESFFDTGTLSVRRGTLRIKDDAVVTTSSTVIGGPAANMVVSRSVWEEKDTLVIGGSAGPGTLTLEEVLMTTRGLFVGPGSTLAGNDTVIFVLSGNFVDLGTISPDIAVILPAVRPIMARAGGLRRVALAEPAALVIDGGLTLGAPAVLRIPVAGPGSFGKLHVTGATTLAGTLELRFVDGFLPTAGDAFAFLKVDGVVGGGFDRILVRGVGEELPFTASFAGGAMTFTALADAKACGSGDGNGDGLADCERCDDCVDDDGDGLVDRADPDCAPAADGAGLGIGGDAAARKALGKCAATMAAVGAKLSAVVATHLQKCTDAVLACVQTKPGDAACLTKAKATCVKATAGLAPDGSDRRKARLTIAKACGAKTPGAPPAVPLATIVAATGLGFDAEVARCAALATPVLASVDDVIACIDRATVCRASALFATRVPRASELLLTANVNAALLACLPVGAPDGGAFGDAKTTGKPLTKCQRAIVAASAKLATRLTKGYGSCAAAMRACVQSADPAACLPKAAASCTKATRTLPTVKGGADAKLLTVLTKACGTLAPGALQAANGLGFERAGSRCAALGIPALDDPAALATCLSREQACGSATLVEGTTPRLRELLGKAGVTLD